MGALSIWHVLLLLLVLIVVVLLAAGVALVVWLVVRSARNRPAQTWVPPQEPNGWPKQPQGPQSGQPQQQ